MLRSLAELEGDRLEALAADWERQRMPDWIAGLEDRAESGYDSGCLSCHAVLKDA